MENPEGAERARFYPSSRPYFIVDGTFLEEFYSGSEQKIKNKINERKLLTAPVNITISSSCPSTSGTASVTVKNTSPSEIRGTLQVLLKERGVKYTEEWKAGFVDNVVRDMLPDPKGEAVTIPAGQSVTKTRTFTINNAWKKDSCRIVAFLQKSDKEIVEGCISGVNVPVSTSTETSTSLQKTISVQLHQQSLAVSIPERGNGVISLFNAQGKILSKHIINNSDKECLEIPVMAYSGIVLLRIQMENMTYTERIRLY